MPSLNFTARISDAFSSAAATSTEEIGNPVHRGTRAKLGEYGISTEGKYAVQLTKSDYDKYDYFIGMDTANIRNMNRIFGSDKDGKIYKLLTFAGRGDDVADPWYSRDFETTYRDIDEGCRGLIRELFDK
mgnify:CR=1 FL=1